MIFAEKFAGMKKVAVTFCLAKAGKQRHPIARDHLTNSRLNVILHGVVVQLVKNTTAPVMQGVAWFEKSRPYRKERGENDPMFGFGLLGSFFYYFISSRRYRPTMNLYRPPP